MRRSLRRIALIYDTTLSYDLNVMAGVVAYARDCTDYNICIEEYTLREQRPPRLGSWDGDGIIANFDDPMVSRVVLEQKLPAVGFGSTGNGRCSSTPSVPYFLINNKMISSIAADHLLNLGFRQFGYCGYPKTAMNSWSEARGKSFASHLQRRGFLCDVYIDRQKTLPHWTGVQISLAKWLSALPKPVAIMAANDNRARHVLEACRSLNLRVPDDVAVMGVGNDELLCQTGRPPLSSVDPGAKRLGYEAVKLLDGIICGRKPRRRRFVIDPTEVVTRQSTDVVAIDDPIVGKAVSFIQEHAYANIKVPKVVEAVAVSRSKLETRFNKALGYSIHTAIRQVQLERARKLISSTSLPLKEIAANVGFQTVQHMTVLFGRTFGRSPGRFRKLQLSPSLSSGLANDSSDDYNANGK
jgi:LacI family transcriptional regulator